MEAKNETTHWCSWLSAPSPISLYKLHFPEHWNFHWLWPSILSITHPSPHSLFQCILKGRHWQQAQSEAGWPSVTAPRHELHNRHCWPFIGTKRLHDREMPEWGT
jgi:hypothetical protein